MHSVDESPGVYGEIANYWQTIDEDELNKDENTEYTDYDYATVIILKNSFQSIFHLQLKFYKIF